MRSQSWEERGRPHERPARHTLLGEAARDLQLQENFRALLLSIVGMFLP
jgi:hypothetical protein